MSKTKNVKIPKWPKSKLEKFLEGLPRLIKQEVKRAVRWFFFYTYKDNMDAFLHIIDILALGFIAWRLIS